MYTFTDVLLLTALLPEAEELRADETDGRVFRNLSARRALLTVIHLEQLIVLLGKVNQPWRVPGWCHQ